jgi:hypothetical protein
LAEAVGPFESYVHAKKVKEIWTDITRGENGRHMKGMKIVGMINGHEDPEDEGEQDSDERLLELKDYAKRMNFNYVVRCFSRIVNEDVPYCLLKKMPPSMCKPSESETLTLNKVMKCFLSTQNGQHTDEIKGIKRGIEKNHSKDLKRKRNAVKVPIPSPFSEDEESDDDGDPFMTKERPIQKNVKPLNGLMSKKKKICVIFFFFGFPF